MMVVMGVGLTGNAEIKNTRNIWIWYITGNNNYHPRRKERMDEAKRVQAVIPIQGNG